MKRLICLAVLSIILATGCWVEPDPFSSPIEPVCSWPPPGVACLPIH